ncbi:FAD-dependent oxidoreductase [Plantactinospora sp. KLBMP9567]|uniref:FAD-dependent oxidoreductase n=1 Tax=Plantactinospora sp. KLBMP9567 TaxID=3085900 RepID=UPI002982B410|nr:FAD-dependent oxidoreductase [Plantactinospora sp. KLBMP9567]MDW5330760.1 FAD-dependent oxidoreductase [Plantactinospora sp. KLBMP9567]
MTKAAGNRGVVVVGGGAAGIAAAVCAARAGAATTLIEAQGFVGGNSAILPWLGFHSRDYRQVVRGIAAELVTDLHRQGHASGFVLDPVCGSAVSLDNHHYRIRVMRLLHDAGVRLLLHSPVVGVDRRDDRVTAVHVENKSGRQSIPGDIFIDASGDGDVGYHAGATWSKGRTADGRVQAPTLVFRVGGVDRTAMVEGLRRDHGLFRDLLADHPTVLAKLLDRLPEQDVIVFGGFTRALAEARQAGTIDVPATRVVGVKTHPTDEFAAVSTKVADFDPTDTAAISRAYTEAYAQIPQLLAFFTKAIPGFAGCRLLEIAPMLGIRESRRVHGDYLLTTDDVSTGATFPDAVAIGAYHIDIHRPDGSWVDSRSVRPYDIPLRCLTAKGIENLLIAGKCVSASHEALASTRVIPTCMAQGQAAGTVAALAAARDKDPREVPYSSLRNRLRHDGAQLRETLPPADPALIERYGALPT